MRRTPGLSGSPECIHGHGPQVRTERQGFNTCVQHDAAMELLSGRLAERLEPAEVPAADGGGSLDLNADDPAVAGLENDVDLLAGVGAKVEQARARAAPRSLLRQLHHDE